MQSNILCLRWTFSLLARYWSSLHLIWGSLQLVLWEYNFQMKWRLGFFLENKYQHHSELQHISWRKGLGFTIRICSYHCNIRKRLVVIGACGFVQLLLEFCKWCSHFPVSNPPLLGNANLIVLNPHTSDGCRISKTKAKTRGQLVPLRCRGSGWDSTADGSDRAKTLDRATSGVDERNSFKSCPRWGMMERWLP